MNILLVSTYFPPEVGSASHLFADLGEELSRRGHTVDVITGYPTYNIDPSTLPERYKKGWFMKEEYHQMKVLRTRAFGMPRGIPILRGLEQLANSLTLAYTALLRHDGRSEIVLIYSPPLFLGLTGMIVRLLKKGKVVLNVQDLFPQAAIDLGLLRNQAMISLLKRFESYIYRHVDAVTVHSPGNRNYIVSHGGDADSTFVVPNVVDTDLITPGPRLNTFRKQYNIPPDEIVVSFAGVLGYSQDLDTIVGAARLLADKPGVKFYIVGDGVEKRRTVELAQGLSNIRFLPMIPKEEYVELLRASDIGLVTLRGSVKTPVVPSKILSIMAAGRPVVAALPLGGDAPGLIAEAQCGICVEPENPAELSLAIRSIIESPDCGARYGLMGRKFAEKNLSTGVSASIYEDVFKQLFIHNSQHGKGK